MRLTGQALPVWVTSLAVTALGLAGCGGEQAGPQTVDVAGTVTHDGQPLADAMVYFMTDEFTSSARTDSTGKFELAHGAVPGTNKIYISKMEGGDLVTDPEAGMDAEQFRAMQQSTQGNAPASAPADGLPKELLPPEISDPQRSTLTFDVPDDGTSAADFQL